MLYCGSTGYAQEDPSFDCVKASTQIEKVLCSGGNSGMGWIDQTMAALYKEVREAPGTDASTLQANQRAWLARRNKCTGSDEEVMGCLFDSYRSRFAELSSSYDRRHLTGRYKNDRVNGYLDSVLFPDGSLSVSITSNGGPPGYDQCAIAFRAPLNGERVYYMDSQNSPSPGNECTVELTITGARIQVAPTGCLSYCGMAASFESVYNKQ